MAPFYEKMIKLSEIERRILESIKQIREKKRSKPSLEAMFTYVNNNGEQISIKSFKENIHYLEECHVIYNGAKEHEKGESYFINFEESEWTINNVSPERVSVSVSEEEFLTKDEFNLADDIYSTIFPRLKNYIEEEIHKQNCMINNKFDQISKNQSGPNVLNSSQRPEEAELICRLNNEIVLLKEELRCKQVTIDLLLNEKQESNEFNGKVDEKENSNKRKRKCDLFKTNAKENENNKTPIFSDNTNFIYPRRHAKRHYVERSDNTNRNIVLSNRFNAFTENGNSDDSFEENTETFRNSMKSKPKNMTDKRRTTTILGDSIVKDLKGNKLKKSLHNENVFIKYFSGATVECMNSYVIPSLKYEPNLVILHCGKNDLRSEKGSEEIANEILNLALKIKKPYNDVIISGLATRNDDLNDKGLEVNDHLYYLSKDYDLEYIDNTNISARHHLSNGGLHLNFKGSSVLAKNFINAIKL